MEENNNGRLSMVLAGIAGLLVGFLAGWLWVDTGEVENTSDVKEDESAIDLDDLNVEEAKDTDTTKTTDTTKKTTTSPTPTPKPTTVTPVATPVASASENKVTVEAQTAGVAVTIANLTLKTKSWVVIHDNDNGKPLRVLGAKRFDTGMHANVTMKLLRATEAGKTYFAMIHSDNGDTAFETAKDLPVTTSDGSPVMTQFEVK